MKRFISWTLTIKWTLLSSQGSREKTDKVEIIKHCRKTLLYYEDSVWIKKGEGGNFDVSIGAYDGAEICELVGCVLL